MGIKKFLGGAMAVALACSMLAGCGSSTNESGAASSKETGKPIETDYGTVTLMSGYGSLKGEKTMVTIDDSDVDSEVNNYLSEYTEYKDVKRAAKEGDYVYLAMKITVDGEVQEDYSKDTIGVTLGDQEFGEEVDSKLYGAKAGDKLKVTVTYEEDDEFAYYPGSTVVYSGKVDKVSEVIVPELTEEFVKDKLGYDSIEDMRTQILEDLKKDYDEENLSGCKENLIQQVIDGSEFGDYDEEMYNQMLAETKANYESYAEMFGMELSEMLESFYGMTEDDLGSEALNSMHRYAVELAIAQEQGLTVSDEEYEEGLAHYVELAGYESGEELEGEYGKESISFWLLEDKVLNYLFDNADITEVEPSADEYLDEDTDYLDAETESETVTE